MYGGVGLPRSFQELLLLDTRGERSGLFT
jgi:hypothetical protein